MRRPITSLLLTTLAVYLAPLSASAQESSADHPNPTGQTVPPNLFDWHLPDPDANREQARRDLEEAEAAGKTARIRFITRTRELVESIHRSVQLRLSLEDVIRRTLENNYFIETQRFNPAVETTRLVEAEAAFDAVFFTNVQKSNIDRPTGSQLVSTDFDSLDVTAGVRKILPSGMSVSGSYRLGRTKTTLVFQQINPEYTTNFVLEMRQPLLRGFGIDANRAIIRVRRNDRRISEHVFRRQVRDKLREVEELYWRLVQARRDVMVSARLVTEFEQILAYLDARRDFDIIPVNLAATEANLAQTRADFIRRVAGVFDAEDRLIAAMNAEDVDLADDTEIVPTDVPLMTRVQTDRLAAVQSAIQHRAEINEQRLRVINAKINVGSLKNAELPKLDLTFRQTVDGLAGNADGAFDEASRFKFIEYFIGIEFEVPVGNRGPRAAHHRASLQHAQQIAGLKQAFEEVILDVNLAKRRLDTTYDQIAPSFDSAQAREREVASIVARAERKDLNTLNSELNARQSLATSRRNMLSAMVEYNIAIIDLERAKGTLLSYNNIVIPNTID